MQDAAAHFALMLIERRASGFDFALCLHDFAVRALNCLYWNLDRADRLAFFTAAEHDVNRHSEGCF